MMHSAHEILYSNFCLPSMYQILISINFYTFSINNFNLLRFGIILKLFSREHTQPIMVNYLIAFKFKFTYVKYV